MTPLQNLWPDVSHRRLEPELMDQPQLDAVRHHEALAGLARLNRWSRSAALVASALAPLARQAKQQGRGPLDVLDVATGGGDIPIALARHARRRGWPLRLEACDISPRAIDYARRQAEAAGSEVRFFQLDALEQPFPRPYDVITTSLFLHHLDEAEALRLLERLRGAARRMVVINDLRRSRTGYLLAAAASRLLTRSRVVHIDARLSAAAAFTSGELTALAERAGLRGARAAERWPFRMLLVWQPEQAST